MVDRMLTERATNILNLIVDDYINTGAPIASQTLVRTHDLGVSSATIRNDVSGLEQGGYITRPHTSAGSVPLDPGYRTYVETVAMSHRIVASERRSMRDRFIDVEREIDEWTEFAAAVLAGLVGSVAIVTFPKAPESRVRQVRLVPLQDLQTLLIVVLNEARLRRQLIPLSRPLDDGELDTTANRVTDLVRGLSWEEIDSQGGALTPLEEDLLRTTVDILREEDRAGRVDHYVDGLRNLFAQQEFADRDALAGFVEAVEDGRLAQATLDQAPDAPFVKVIIGHENSDDLLQPMGVVISRYGVPGQMTGTIAAVGPVRMHYKKAVSVVDLMADVMGELVGGVSGQ